MFNRSLVKIADFADPRLSAEIHVAEIPALILTKGSKIGEPEIDRVFGIWRTALTG